MAAVTAAVQLRTGDAIEVRCHFNCSWARGFSVADVVTEDDEVLYRIRRASDGAVLPALFPAAYIRDADHHLFT